MKLERSRARVGGARIHAVHSGAGEPVVLLHGLSGSYRWWRFTVPPLARRFRVHMPDLVGFGASRGDASPPPMPEMAGVIADWLDDRRVGPAHLVGHSMGGQVAIHLAATRPERFRRVVLVGAAGIPRDFTLAEAARLLAELVPPRAWGRPAFLPTIALDALRAGPRVLLRSLLHLLDDDVRPLLGRVPHRTLLVWGEYDPLVPREHGRIMEQSIRASRFVVVPDAGHVPMADRPAEFNRILSGFLADA